MAFLPRGDAHGLAAPLTGPPAAPRARTPDATPDTALLCGAYLLDPSCAHPLMRELPDVVHLPARLGHHSPLRTALDLLCGELENPAPGQDAMVSALLDLLLLHILRACFERRKGATGWAAALNDSPVASALRAMHSRPHHLWTVLELAQHAGLSRAAFARRFTTLVGRPPLSYLTWWRMTLAAKLLRASDTPANVVAGKVGYTSEYAFAHAFKRAYGQPPGTCRRQEHRPSE